MKVLIILDNGSLHGSCFSGGIKFLSELAKHFRKNKYEIHILTSEIGKESYLKQGLSNMVNFHITQFLRSQYLMKYEVYQIIELIIRMIKSLSCNIPLNSGIIRSSDQIYDIIPAIWFKLRYPTLKLMVSVFHIIPAPSKRPRGFTLSNVMSYLSQRISLKLIGKWADIINTENTFIKNYLEDCRIPPERIIVVSGGIDLWLINSIQWHRERRYDACFLARLHPSKGIFDLVKAWKYVCERKKDAKLAIAGGGSIEIFNKLKSTVKSLGLERNVAILGFLSEEDKYKLLSSSKLYVLPSYEEGIPITFYEAMYCGLPVVTYYLPTYEGIKDYIVSVPLGDVKKLAEEIIRLLEDENLARKLGDRGREFAKEHTWDKVAECIISHLEKLK
jgi:glycosyltransferase involved in cell wall biosynthesis